MTRWCHRPLVSARPDPVPCRPQDLGKFEILQRDGSARIGRLHTKHGMLNTPMLLPVVNPNIRTIEPREMWDKYRVDGLITNSYVMWKHNDLSEYALEHGVHKLIDFPGVVVTDSGTFQSYVYGDVEVGVEEIVEFQRDIGVDVGTMLDVFGRPDMSREQIISAVDITAERAPISLEKAGEGLLLNGPIQGGLHDDLRALAGQVMGDVSGVHRGFTVHPIGGIVPLMENQKYRELFQILLSAKSTLPPNRPIHLFGCGHPLLFPMSIALGVDIFDSAAYALFARGGRLLTPTGTVRLEEIQEWPHQSSELFNWTPEEVRGMESKEREKVLARHNLEVTQSELARCREAIRNGKIWQLAEERSHSSGQLREAFLWVLEQLDEPDGGPVGVSAMRMISSTNPVRSGGENLVDDIEERPHILHFKSLLSMRWRIPGSWWDGSSGPPKRVVIIEGSKPPWRDSSLHTVISSLKEESNSIVVISTPIGLIPYSMEDVSPWCHIDGSDEIWDLPLDEYEIVEELEELDLSDLPFIRISPGPVLEEKIEGSQIIRDWLDKCSIVDKLSVLNGLSPTYGCKITSDMTSRRSKTDRMVNLYSKGVHVISPRLNDGGISLTLEGARLLHSYSSKPPLSFGEEHSGEELDHPGIARVMIIDDAIPFVGQGRNVMQGYVLGADPHLIPGQPCLVVDSKGNLVAHGLAITTAREMAYLNKGLAVRIRDGALKDSDI
jgi:7-cyano-7-deazaguanine tRNA-ribosyltransferase